MKNNVPSNILDVITRLVAEPTLAQYGYWGHFGTYLTYKEDRSIPYVAVGLSGNTPVFLYNPDNTSGLDTKMMMFLYLHEISHLVGDHITRIFSTSLDSRAGNVAADIVVNEAIFGGDVIPKRFVKDLPDGSLRRPVAYNGNMILEDIYEWLLENEDELDALCPDDDMFNHSHESVMCDVDNALSLNEIVSDLKTRGLETSNIKTVIGKISPNRYDYIGQVSSLISSIMGHGQIKRTYARPNRKGIKGVKGKRKVKRHVNVIIDTSGSISESMYRIIMSILMRTRAALTVYMIDSSIQSITDVNSASRVPKLEIRGGGGTVLQPGIDKASELHPSSPIVIMTDGYTDTLDLSHFGRNSLILLTDDRQCPIIGDVKQVFVK